MMARNVAFKVALALAVLWVFSLLAGCCTYRGKAISRSDAERMRNLGMDVHCPGEPRVVNGQYRASLLPPAHPCWKYRKGGWRGRARIYR